MIRIFYFLTVAFGIFLGFFSLFSLPDSPFVQFNWYGLFIFVAASAAFVLSFRFKKFLPYIFFALGILAMLNTYFYFKECSQIKGIELFGGFFISIAPIFSSEKGKKIKK